jgi:DNA-binding response OmpR family regulator
MEEKLKDKKILIVDDEPDVLDTLEDLLPMCKITKASTFEEAKKQLETQPFDIAILDIMGVDGYKLLEIANKRKVIAVMLTAHALSPENTVKSFKAGAAHFIPKDKIIEITTFLNDILDAKTKSKSLWSKWLERMDSYYTDKFGKDWKEDDREFWAKFNRYT